MRNPLEVPVIFTCLQGLVDDEATDIFNEVPSIPTQLDVRIIR
jgi:hypothetical protein